ncbi:hypothetical protein EDB86DRAFT_2828658 [Lactarius hatsudake]|nr:hypothetical protein EDB86DRAFT_2828658 [Lactarius hatsudake]
MEQDLSSDGGNNVADVNTVEVYRPAHANADNSSDGSDWHPLYPVDDGIIDLMDTDLEEWDADPVALTVIAPSTIIEDDNDRQGGVKTLEVLVFALDLAIVPAVDPVDSDNFDFDAFYDSYLDRHMLPRKVRTTVTDDTNDNEWALFAPRTPPHITDDKTSEGRGKTLPPASALNLGEPIGELQRITPPSNPQKLVLPAPAIAELPPQMPPLPTPRNPQRTYPPLFLAHAFEQPRNLDEITPQTPRPPPTPQPTTQHRRTNAVDNIPPWTTNPDTTRDRNGCKAHTNSRIHEWLTQIIYKPPPRTDSRPVQRRNTTTEECVDPNLHEYRYDYDYPDAR